MPQHILYKNLKISWVVRESVLYWRMALEHDSRKIEKEQDKTQYAEEEQRKAYDDRIDQRRNVTDVKYLDP